jgi:hypothetical protein
MQVTSGSKRGAGAGMAGRRLEGASGPTLRSLVHAARSKLRTVSDACAGLTPRQRQTLRCLLQG